MNKEFWIAAGWRAVRTICQTALSFLAIGMTVTEVNWLVLASTSLVAGVISILTSVVTGLPEADGVDGTVGELTVVESGETGQPQILLALNSKEALEVIKKKSSVKLDTSKIKV